MILFKLVNIIRQFDCDNIVMWEETQSQKLEKEEIKKSLMETVRLLGLTSPTSSQLQRAHHLVSNLCKIVQLPSLILQILQDPNLSQLQKRGSCTIIDNYMRIQTSALLFDRKHDHFSIHEVIYKILVSPKIEVSLKIIIERAYARLIHFDKSCQIRKDLAYKIGIFFGNKNSNPNNEQLSKMGQQLKNMRYLIRSLLHGKIQTDVMRQLIQHILSNLGKWIVSDLQTLTEALKERNQQKFIHKIEITAIGLDIYKLVFIKTDLERFPMLKLELITNSQLATIIVLSFQLTLPDIDPRFIIETRGEQNLQYINDIKKYSLEILCNSLRVVERHKKQSLWEKQGFKKILISSQALFSVLPGLISKEIANYPLIPIIDPQLLREALRFISLIVKVTFSYSLAEQQKDLILYGICLPCILPSKESREKSAEDYKSYRDDIANTQQEINSIEINAGKVIQSFVDNIDGCLTKFITAITNLIRFHLTALPLHFQQIPPVILNTTFYKEINFQDQIQTLLLGLSTVSYRIQGRLDIALKLHTFIVESRDYFINFNLNCYVISAFFSFYSYFADNFYTLIQKGTIDRQLHVQIFKFAIEATIHFQSVQNSKKQVDLIILQALDCIQNTINQKLFISQLFPHEQSYKQLIQCIQILLQNFMTKYNGKAAEIILDFYKQTLRINMKKGKQAISPLVRNQISIVIATKLSQHYPKIKFNEVIVKQKIFQIFEVLAIVSSNPVRIYEIIRGFLVNYLTYVGHQEHILSTIGTILSFIKQKEDRAFDGIVKEIHQQLIKGFSFIQQNGSYGVLFGIFQDLVVLGIKIQELLISLMNFFFSLEDVSLQEHTSYLILMIASLRYHSVGLQTWTRVMQAFLAQLEKDYIKQQSCVYGKLLCVVLCILEADFNYWSTIYVGEPLNIIWKLILANQKTYRTSTEKRICTLKLISFVRKYGVDIPLGKQILKMSIMLTYYSRNKQQNWDDQDEDNSDESDNDKEYWQKVNASLAKNIFIDTIEDEAAKLRDLSNELVKNTDWCKEFIDSLPIALKNFVKNKILNYKQVGTHSSTRCIYKVKRS